MTTEALAGRVSGGDQVAAAVAVVAQRKKEIEEMRRAWIERNKPENVLRAQAESVGRLRDGGVVGRFVTAAQLLRGIHPDVTVRLSRPTGKLKDLMAVSLAFDTEREDANVSPRIIYAYEPDRDKFALRTGEPIGGSEPASAGRYYTGEYDGGEDALSGLDEAIAGKIQDEHGWTQRIKIYSPTTLLHRFTLKEDKGLPGDPFVPFQTVPIPLPQERLTAAA